MTYVSVKFILFLFAFFIIYFIVPGTKGKQGCILLGNCLFYLASGINGFIILLLTSIIAYKSSLMLQKKYENYYPEAEGLEVPQQVKLFSGYKKKNFPLLLASLLLIVGILVYVKLGRYFMQAEAGFLIVPIGLSYYTLSIVGYLIDIYEGRVFPERNFFKFFLCVSYFPHIIQGPIGRYERLLKQVEKLPGFSYDRMSKGLCFIIWGLFKKLVLADTLSLYTTRIFGQVADFTLLQVVLAIVLYAIQLYADFSGCMDMASGISGIIGIELDKNFACPFFSKGAAEFWRRWHITLGLWFRDYIYMPIANASWLKKRTRKLRKNLKTRAARILGTALPSAVVWILTGLWHGTGMDYLLWGCYWGGIIIVSGILENWFKGIRDKCKIREDNLPFGLFQTIRTFFIYCVGIAIVAPGSMSALRILITETVHKCMNNNWGHWQIGSLLSGAGLTITEIGVILIGLCILFLADFLQNRALQKGGNIVELLLRRNILVRWSVLYLLIFMILLFGRFGLGNVADTFMYAFY